MGGSKKPDQGTYGDNISILALVRLQSTHFFFFFFLLLSIISANQISGSVVFLMVDKSKAIKLRYLVHIYYTQGKFKLLQSIQEIYMKH